MNPTAAQGVLAIYGLLLIGGGAVGYFKAGSRASLVAGTLSGLLAFAALGASTRGVAGYGLGVVLAALMLVVFGVRLSRTRKFMPSGLLALASLIVLVVLGFQLF